MILLFTIEVNVPELAVASALRPSTRRRVGIWLKLWHRQGFKSRAADAEDELKAKLEASPH